MPAIVVGHHRHSAVRNLCLARQFGLRHIGHADHVTAPFTIEIGFREGGELRAFHYKVGAATLHGDVRGSARGLTPVTEPCVNGMRHGYMSHHARAEKTFLPGKSAVDKLINDDKRTGGQVLMK